jgi:predicted Zn-dependent peptidase
VFENDSVTNIAHQLGYFETVVGAGYFPTLEERLGHVTADQVNQVARKRLTRTNRTVGWFQPAGGRS